MAKKHSPAAERNSGPIFEVLAPMLAPNATVLEIGSGTGQHAVHFARSRPDIRWYPTDQDQGYLDSVEAMRKEYGLPNL